MLIMSSSRCQTLCFIPSASTAGVPQRGIPNEDELKGQLAIDSQELWFGKSKPALASTMTKP